MTSKLPFELWSTIDSGGFGGKIWLQLLLASTLAPCSLLWGYPKQGPQADPKTIEKLRHIEDSADDDPRIALQQAQELLATTNRLQDPATWFAIKVEELGSMERLRDAQSLQAALQGLDSLAESLPFSKFTTSYLCYKASSLQFLGKKHEAESTLLLALQQSELIARDDAILDSLASLGWFYQNNDDQKRALEYFIRGRELAKKTGDPRRYSTFLGGIASVYTFGSDDRQKEALELFDEVYAFQRSKNYRSNTAIALINKGQLYLQRNELKLAIATLNKALVPLESLKDEALRGYVYLKLGAAYNSQKLYPESLDAIAKAELLFRGLSNDLLVAESWLLRSLTFIDAGQALQAIHSLESYEKLANKDNLDSKKLASLELKAKAYAQLGWNDKELHIYREAYPILQRENEEQAKRTMTKLSAEMDLERKEAENRLLEQKSKLEQEAHAIEAKFQLEKIQRQQDRFYFLVSIVIFFLTTTVVAILLLFRLRSRNQKIEKLQTYIHQSVLSRFLPPAIVEEIIQGNSRIESKPREELITILFSDLVGFTSLSSQIGANNTAEILNIFMQKMTEVIYRHEGTIDKFIGDSVMVIFGAPLALPERIQAERAVGCARDMLHAIDEVNIQFRQQFKVELDMRIGINTGPAIVGTFGNERRSDYTAIGPNVNLASRIEGKANPHEVLISQEVAKHLSKDDYEERGSFHLRGIDAPVPLFAVTLNPKARVQLHAS